MATRQHLAYTPSSSAASSQQHHQQQRGYTSAYTPSYNNQTSTRAANGSRHGHDSIAPGPSSSPYPGTYSSNYHHQNQPIPTINAVINNKGGRRIPGTSTPMGPSHHSHSGNGGGRGSGARKVFGHPL